MSTITSETIMKSFQCDELLIRRRGSVSYRREKLRIKLEPYSESDGEVDKCNRNSPSFARKTLKRWNKKAHEAVERVEDYVFHIWDVVSHHSLPEWLQDNEYLLSGHRPQLNSYKACFKSIFRIHSETGNIWTHLLAAIGFVLIAIYFLLQPSVIMKLHDKLVYLSYFSGAFICLSFSWLFHTLYCHSPPVGNFFSRLDYCGISIMIIASFIPWLYYGFYCQNTARMVYLSMVLIFGSACIAVSMGKRFSSPDYRPIRALIFTIFGGSGIIPASHFVLLHGFQRVLEDTPLIWAIFMGLSYLSGALIYAYRLPERFWPGKFDYWGQSHQIFHIMVVISAFINVHAMNLLNANYEKISECSTP